MIYWKLSGALANLVIVAVADARAKAKSARDTVGSRDDVSVVGRWSSWLHSHPVVGLLQSAAAPMTEKARVRTMQSEEAPSL